jgi:hypothetical protein
MVSWGAKIFGDAAGNGSWQAERLASIIRIVAPTYKQRPRASGPAPPAPPGLR